MKKTLITLAVALLAAGPALADITVGVSLPLTGPASGLGIPMQNQIKLWPATVAGEKLNVIVLDDATDPTKGVQNARRFVTEDKVDVIIGSAATSAIGIATGVIAEPMMRSTLSSATKRRAFCTPLVGSLASSSTMRLSFSPAMLAGHSLK